jgi:hypothetical protein
LQNNVPYGYNSENNNVKCAYMCITIRSSQATFNMAHLGIGELSVMFISFHALTFSK